MRFFITGGTGFNGRHLLKKLQERDDEILILTRNRGYKPGFENVKTLYGVLSNISAWKDELKKFSPDVAIHLAWDGIPNDYGPIMGMKNLINSLGLVEVLAEINCPKLVLTGTCWEYGREEGEVNEGMEPKPAKPIAIAKDSLYKMANEIAKEKGITLIWARFFYVYGPGRKDSTLVPYIATSLIENTPPKIKTPDNKFDFIYVEDVANAVSMIAKSPNSTGIYNIGSGKSTSVRTLVKISCEQLGKRYNENDFPAQNDKLVDFWADISKIKREVGWEPKVNIEDGIARTIESIKFN